MAEDWPVGVNTNVLVGIKDKRLSAKVRSPMDAGPPIVRRRFTVAVRNVDFPMTFTNTERALFDTWYETVIDEGVLSFLFPDPVTDALVAMRFRENEGPDFSADVGADNDDERRWSVVLPLEILP